MDPRARRNINPDKPYSIHGLSGSHVSVSNNEHNYGSNDFICKYTFMEPLWALISFLNHFKRYC